MPDLAPWLPLLAIPFDAEVPSTPEVDALDPAASRERLLETVETFLERILMMPTLLVFEDAHWLDDSSRSLLRHLTRQGGDAAVAHLRDDAPGQRADRASRRPGERVDLEPLEADRAAELALAIADEVALSSETLAALTERSGGNPLFVRELVNAARAGDRLETLPESVESLLTSPHRHARPGEPDAPPLRGRRRSAFELDFVGEILADDIPTLAIRPRWEWLREFVGYAGDMDVRVPARPRSRDRVRGAVVPAAP